ncbi:MAG: DUF3052 domain-containing protein, partial [Candidatus Nanopelagicaceae bacterium]
MPSRMGFEKGQVILEVGHGSDCDEDFRKQLIEITGESLIENEANEVVDAVLIWFREDDGDLADELVDALTFLSDSGPIWVLTPKVGRDGHVHPSDIQDAANTAGLSQTSTIAAAPNWSATKIVHRKAK